MTDCAIVTMKPRPSIARASRVRNARSSSTISSVLSSDNSLKIDIVSTLAPGSGSKGSVFVINQSLLGMLSRFGARQNG